MIERAQSIAGWMTDAELLWLGQQAARRRQIAEIGSWRGRSTAAMADSSTATIWAIDNWTGSPETDFDPEFQAGGPEWLYRDFREHAADNVTPFRMDSRAAAAKFAEGGHLFDMIFIDGAHDVASVKADLEAWRPLLAPGGLLCGHDYFTTVKEAVDSTITAIPVEGTSIWMEKPVLSPTAILVPSLNRPQRLRDTVANIHANTAEPHEILFMVSDQASMDILDELDEWYIDDSDGEDRRYVTRMNKLIDHLGDARTIFFGSDDVIHHQGWLTAALKLMETGPSCVVVNDLHNMAGTQAVIRREYLQRAVYDAPGLAFHPGYLHNFADNEMFWTASVQHELAQSTDAIVEHLHPLFQSANSIAWDSTYHGAMTGWAEDEQRFKARHDAIKAAIPTKLTPVRTFW